MFKSSFLKQMNIFLQVERFASMKSVEKYLINGYATKYLFSTNEAFSKKRSKDIDESPSKNAVLGNIDKEKILTSSYLEKKMEERNLMSKEKDFRKYFEKQYIRKPSKLIRIIFEYKYIDDDGDVVKRPVDIHTTIHELVTKVAKDISKKSPK